MGYERGWTADGVGTHYLDLTWHRPVSWGVRGWPELALFIRTPAAQAVNSKTSFLTVFLNESPIATWELRTLKVQDVVRVRIPRVAWGDKFWSFRIRVTMYPREHVPCGVLDTGSPWLTIDPESRLDVPRDEYIFPGISHFISKGAPRPLLRQAHLTKWHTIEHVAPVLFALSQYTQKARTWKWEARHESRKKVIAIDEFSPSSSIQAPPWMKWQESKSLPFISPTDVVYLGLEHAEGLGETLRIAVGEQSEVPEVPVASGLIGQGAFYYNNQWTLLGVVKPIGSLKVSNPRTHISSAAISIQQRALKTIDYVIVSSFVGLIVCGWWWVRRGASKSKRNSSSGRRMRSEDIES